jgi:transposase-like protein
MTPKLNAQQRLKLIERVILKKESVAKICRENNISRVIFYRWLKRYLQADKNTKALEPQRKTEATVMNRVDQGEEAKILEIVISNPNLSCKGIYNELPKDSSGKPIVGYHGVQNVLERLKLSTREQRVKYGQNISKTEEKQSEYNYLTADQKLAILNRVLVDKEQVSDVCKEYGLSRTAFYNIKEKYLQAPVGDREEVLERKKPEISRYWRQTPEEYERAVLDLVGKHPEYGIRNLLTNLPQIGGVPIVSHHGIQNILRRNNLSLYEQRLA